MQQLQLRGISADRFRDLNVFYGQTEYRFPFSDRFIGAAFAGMGDVFNRLDDLEWAHLKLVGGGGIRYVIEPREKVTVRFDLGVSRWGAEPYLMLQESF